MNKLLSAAGGFITHAVDAGLALTRALWKTYLEEQRTGTDAAWAPQLIELSREDLARNFREEIYSSELPRVKGLDPDELETVFFNEIFSEGPDRVRQRYFSSLYTLRRLLDGDEKPAEIRYALMRRIRERNRIVLNSTTARVIHRLADVAQRLAAKESIQGVHRNSVFEPALHQALEELAVLASSDNTGSNYLEFALSVWKAIRAIKPSALAPGHIEFSAELLSASRLLATSFGLPTSIEGLDEIFNGGLILPDAAAAQSGADEQVGSRVVVVTAPFGSGKSLLSLQIAVEVARKGGIAWVLALEQTPEECLYSLESIGVAVRGQNSFSIVSGFKDAFPVLSDPIPRQGALVFLPAVEPGAAFQELVDTLPRKFTWLENYRLRLLIVDPLSAIYTRPEDRAQAVRLLHQAKAAGVNLWLTSEHGGKEAKEYFEENIADTVIQLGIDRNSSDRFLEVTKSRLQRERPGRHLLRISSDGGLRVYPPSVVYLREGSASLARRPREVLNTGVPGLPEVMGRRAIFEGDLIALHGEMGTSKTLLGLQFLRAIEHPKNPNLRALFVADLPESQMSNLVRLCYERELPEDAQRNQSHVYNLPISPGLIDPSEILTLIQAKLDYQEARNKPIDRVLISNLSRWQIHMPQAADNHSFALALIGMLRSYGVTAILSCGYSGEAADSPLVTLLLQVTDCALEVKRAAFRGQDRYFLRVLKTHEGQHRRGRFEVTPTASTVSVSPKESLLRVSKTGDVEAVPVLLFLHSETQNHELYNDKLVGALKATLSPNTSIAPQTRSYDPEVLRLGGASALDEVQILQLDEFQLPQAESLAQQHALAVFPYKLAGRLLNKRLKRFRETCVRVLDGERQVIAVPFYANISLLAWQTALGTLPPTWTAMADECVAWEARNPEGLFFACHAANTDRFESYNCLFLEILHSLSGHPGKGEGIPEWLSRGAEKSEEAMRCFHLLLRRYHAGLLQDPKSGRTDAGWQELLNRLTSRAMISRHWYNTANQMFAELGSKDRQGYSVALLPGNSKQAHFTTAGEWYLAVPAHSAAPEVALDVIEYLTTDHNEMQRLHLGVSLPTRSDYYDVNGSQVASDVSPFFEMDMASLADLVTNAFRRSKLPNYQTLAETMSSHLQRMLLLEKPKYAEALHGLTAALKFVKGRRAV